MEEAVKSLTLKAAAGTIALAVAMLPAAPALAVSSANATSVIKGLGYLSTQQQADGQISGFSGVSAWSALAFAAAGTNPANVMTSGGKSLLHYLQVNPPASGAGATEWERDILAITAAGQNPYDFGGVDYVSGLTALHTGGQIGSTTAVNDDSFAVAALVAAHAAKTNPALTDALAFTLAHQHADGGFSYSTDPATGSDVDDTAATILALHAAKDAGLTIPAAAITNAKSYILGTQNSDGGFPYDPLTPLEWGGPLSNVSSTSWVFMALTALGQEDGAPGTNAQKFLRDAQQSDGSFPYIAPSPGDTFDSAYAVMALAGGFWPSGIYDGPVPADALPSPSLAPSVTPTTTPTPTPSPKPATGDHVAASPSPSPTPTGSVLGATASPTAGTGADTNPIAGILPAVGAHATTLGILVLTSIGLAVAFMARRFRRSHKSEEL